MVSRKEGVMVEVVVVKVVKVVVVEERKIRVWHRLTSGTHECSKLWYYTDLLSLCLTSLLLMLLNNLHVVLMRCVGRVACVSGQSNTQTTSYRPLLLSFHSRHSLAPAVHHTLTHPARMRWRQCWSCSFFIMELYFAVYIHTAHKFSCFILYWKRSIVQKKRLLSFSPLHFYGLYIFDWNHSVVLSLCHTMRGSATPSVSSRIEQISTNTSFLLESHVFMRKPWDKHKINQTEIQDNYCILLSSLKRDRTQIFELTSILKTAGNNNIVLTYFPCLNNSRIIRINGDYLCPRKPSMYCTTFSSPPNCTMHPPSQKTTGLVWGRLHFQ